MTNKKKIKEFETKLIGCLVTAGSNAYLIKKVKLRRLEDKTNVYDMELYFLNHNMTFTYCVEEDVLKDWVESSGGQTTTITGYSEI
jgi:hypothetical protein